MRKRETCLLRAAALAGALRMACCNGHSDRQGVDPGYSVQAEASEGDIHYNVYIPEDYDGSEPYALYFTLPGYGGLYFQGAAINLKTEEFAFEAQKYNSRMIIVAPQLNDWKETSARQRPPGERQEAENARRSRIRAGRGRGRRRRGRMAEQAGRILNVRKEWIQ